MLRAGKKPLGNPAKGPEMTNTAVPIRVPRAGLVREFRGLGTGSVERVILTELALIVRLLRGGRYSDAVGRRLYALAAEASRQAAWDYFDQDDHPAARRHFEAALRASATAGDQLTGAYALSFAAVQCYSTGEPQQAVVLLETASDAVARTGTPKMTAMLAARSARAHSKAGRTSQPEFPARPPWW